MLFPPTDEDDKYTILPFCWVPEETIDIRSRKDHVNYDLWARQGYILPTEGNVVDYDAIEQFILSLREKYDIHEIAYDRWNAQMLVQHLADEGLTMVSMGQGFISMSNPTKDLRQYRTNEAAISAANFAQSAACKNLDLPPVNLRFLQLYLAQNSSASAPPHLCGIALRVFFSSIRQLLKEPDLSRA